MIRIILFLALKCVQNNSARVCKCAVYHWFNKTPKRDMASFDLIYWTLGTGSKFVGHTCMFVCLFVCMWVLRWPIDSASVSHQCDPGSIPSWGSASSAVSKKGLSSPV